MEQKSDKDSDESSGSMVSLKHKIRITETSKAKKSVRINDDGEDGDKTSELKEDSDIEYDSEESEHQAYVDPLLGQKELQAVLKAQNLESTAQREAFEKIIKNVHYSDMTQEEKIRAIKTLAVPGKAMKSFVHEELTPDVNQKFFETKTAVQHTVDVHMKPIVAQFQAVLNVADYNKRQLQEYGERMAEMERTVKRQNERLSAVKYLKQELSELELKFTRMNYDFGSLQASMQMETQNNKAQLKDMSQNVDSCFEKIDHHSERFTGLRDKITFDQQETMQDITTREKNLQFLIQETNFRLAEVKNQVNGDRLIYEEFMENIQERVSSQLDKVTKDMTAEIKKVDKLGRFEKHLNRMETRLTSFDPQIKQLTAEMHRLIVLPSFIQHALPIWMLYETSECLKEVFGKSYTGRSAFTAGVGSSNQMRKIINYENKKLREILKYNQDTKQEKFSIKLMDDCLQGKANFHIDKQFGCFPFKMGADYYPTIQKEDINKMSNPKLLQEIKDQMNLLRGQENKICSIMDEYDNVLNSEDYADMKRKTKAFLRHTNHIQPFQIIQLWAYSLNDKLKNQQTDWLFEEITGTDTSMKNMNESINKHEVKLVTLQKKQSKGPDLSSLQKQIDQLKDGTLMKPAAVLTQQEIRNEMNANRKLREGGGAPAEPEPVVQQIIRPATPKLLLYKSMNKKAILNTKAQQRVHVKRLQVKYQQVQNKVRKMQQLFPKDILSLERQIEKDEISLSQVQIELEKHRKKNAEIGSDIFSNPGGSQEVDQGNMLTQRTVMTARHNHLALATARGNQSQHATLQTPFRSEKGQFGFASTALNLHERQMKITQIENSRPQELEKTREFSKDQIIKIQEMIDTNIDWSLTYLKQSVNNHIGDLHEQYEDFKDHVMANCNQAAKLIDDQNDYIEKIDEKVIDCMAEVRKCLDQVGDIHSHYTIDHRELTKYKQRLNSDLREDVTNIVEMVNMSFDNQKNVISTCQSINANRKAIHLMLEESLIGTFLAKELGAAAPQAAVAANAETSESPQHKPGQLLNKDLLLNKVKKGIANSVAQKMHQQNPVAHRNEYNTLMFNKNSQWTNPGNTLQDKDSLAGGDAGAVNTLQIPLVYRGETLTVEKLIDKREELLGKCKDLINWKDVAFGKLPLDIEQIKFIKQQYSYNYVDSNKPQRKLAQLNLPSLPVKEQKEAQKPPQQQAKDIECSPTRYSELQNRDGEVYPATGDLSELAAFDNEQISQKMGQLTPIRTSKLEKLIDRTLDAGLKQGIENNQFEEFSLIPREHQNQASNLEQESTFYIPTAEPLNINTAAAAQPPPPVAKTSGRKTSINLSREKANKGTGQGKMKSLNMPFENSNFPDLISNFEVIANDPKKKLDIFLQSSYCVQKQLDDLGTQELRNHERNKFETICQFSNQIALQNELVKQIYLDTEKMQQTRNIHSRQTNMMSRSKNKRTDLLDILSKRNKTSYGGRRRNTHSALGQSLDVPSLNTIQDVEFDSHDKTFKQQTLQMSRALQPQTIENKNLTTLRNSTRPEDKKLVDLISSHRGSQHSSRQKKSIQIKKLSLQDQNPIVGNQQSIVVNMDEQFEQDHSVNQSPWHYEKKMNSDYGNGKLGSRKKNRDRDVFTSLDDYKDKVQQQTSFKLPLEKARVIDVSHAWNQPVMASAAKPRDKLQHSPLSRPTAQTRQTQRTNKQTLDLGSMSLPHSGNLSSANEKPDEMSNNEYHSGQIYQAIAMADFRSQVTTIKQRIKMPHLKLNTKFDSPSINPMSIGFQQNVNKSRDKGYGTGKIKTGNTSRSLKLSPKNDSGFIKAKPEHEQSDVLKNAIISRKLESIHNIQKINHLQTSDYGFAMSNDISKINKNLSLTNEERRNGLLKLSQSKKTNDKKISKMLQLPINIGAIEKGPTFSLPRSKQVPENIQVSETDQESKITDYMYMQDQRK